MVVLILPVGHSPPSGAIPSTLRNLFHFCSRKRIREMLRSRQCGRAHTRLEAFFAFHVAETLPVADERLTFSRHATAVSGALHSWD